MGEHGAFNLGVQGSNPWRPTGVFNMKFISKNLLKPIEVGLYDDGSTCFVLDNGTIANPSIKPPTKMKTNFIFEDELIIVGSCKKSSTINFLLQSASKGAIYNIFHRDFVISITDFKAFCWENTPKL